MAHPPGWYPCPTTPGMNQWYDGTEWQQRFQPTAQSQTAEATRLIAVVLILLVGVAVCAGVWFVLNASV